MGEVHAVDNYSEFTSNTYEHPRDSFYRQLDTFLSAEEKDKIIFHEIDCFELDLAALPKIDIYFYDGEHSEESHYNALKYFEPTLADTFILVVDDWERKGVRDGTRRALREINYNVVSSRAIIPQFRENAPDNPTTNWWCGAFVAVLEKNA
jgi:hypothetical protein